MKEFKRILKGVDKFGTKTFDVLTTCDRCGGRGEYWWGAIINGSPQYAGVCYRCNGSGKEWTEVKEYTPERRAQLDAQNERRHERKQEKAKAEAMAQMEETMSREGFSADKKTWVFCGETYSRRDQIKALGARFSRELGWHIDHPVDGWNLVEVAFDQIASINDWGRIVYLPTVKTTIEGLKAPVEQEIEAQKPVSEWVGEEKERMTMTLTLQKEYSISTQFGIMNIYRFSDDQGNTIVWKTSGYVWKDKDESIMAEEGDTVTVKATVKAHTEYKGEKQTEVTRVKVA